MSLRVVVAGLALVLGISACTKKKEESPAPKVPATLTTGTVTPEGVRKVPIDVVQDGYAPDRIPGKPGEKLTLVFTRKVDGHCYEELKTPDGKVIALPKNKPVEVPVTVPQEGEVKFACGMDMLTGVVVAEKS
jgi:plastocyanin domain-containing protein